MPDVSLTEFAIIALVVLIVFGPNRLPEISRKAGKWARELRSISREFRRGIEREVAEVKEPLQEIKNDLAGPMAQIKQDLKGPLDDLKKDLKEPLDEIKKDLTEPVEQAAADAEGSEASKEWVGPIASVGPTPGEALEDLDRIEAGEDLLDGESD